MRQGETETSAGGPRVELGIDNLGEPIRLKDVKIAGIAAEAAALGGKAKIWTRLAVTSDEPMFHRIVEHLVPLIESLARRTGSGVVLNRAQTILLVIKPDDSAELWVDTAAMSLRCMTKRGVSAGTVLFEDDIADVTGMAFPCVEIGAKDKVVCLFREDWRFALCFDFNPNGDFDHDWFSRRLGTLYRSLKYRHLYDALANEAVLDRLIHAGWFPFVELLPREFRRLLNLCEANLELAEAENKLLQAFNGERLERILARWVAKRHFSPKTSLLHAAVAAFKNREPVSVIKILLTEIEGILSNAYRAVHGDGAKIGRLLEFAIDSAERKAGERNTLLFPAHFAKYLSAYTFAVFDPEAGDGTAGSRHAVGHGQARAESYTMVGALQAILTMDQIAFFT